MTVNKKHIWNVVNCDINFCHCQVQNFEISNLFTEILQSSFESTKRKTESQQSTLQLHKSQVYTTKILGNIVSFVKSH
jgi:hypothetical protein